MPRGSPSAPRWRQVRSRNREGISVVSGYAERMYARYSEVRPHCSPPSRAQDLMADGAAERKHFLHLLPARRDAAILDLGCGYGKFLYFLQSQGYTETQGIDLNPQQVGVARRLGVRNVECCEGKEFLGNSVGQFDFISAIDVLEHVPKDQVLEFLDRVHAALRPGGRFLCQVPNLAAFYRPLFYMDFSHETPFTATSLKQILELANFANVRVFPMGPVAHGVKSAIRCLVWKAITASLRLTQTIEGGPPDPLDAIYTAAILAAGDKA
jgi:2-polyprenyl-3-methyl-5-hydroxy-6-metoxy-1,4-benzoquinol methylase